MAKKQIGLLIKQLHDTLEKQANNALRNDDITMMQIAVLLTLSQADEKSMTMKELEKHFSVAQPTMTGIVKRLIEKGFLEQLSSPEDRRIKIVKITETGLETCRLASVSMDTTEQQILRGFTEAEIDTLEQLLTKALNNL